MSGLPHDLGRAWAQNKNDRFAWRERGKADARRGVYLPPERVVGVAYRRAEYDRGYRSMMRLRPPRLDATG
jgi:ATP-dependent DNA ligase